MWKAAETLRQLGEDQLAECGAPPLLPGAGEAGHASAQEAQV
jgi:hypothetical protein